MANHAHSTPTPLLPQAGLAPPLLTRGAGRQLGPVSAALAAMHAADPDRQRIRALRTAIGDRIEADIALLDALSGDVDLEDDDREHDHAEAGLGDADGLAWFSMKLHGHCS